MKKTIKEGNSSWKDEIKQLSYTETVYNRKYHCLLESGLE